MADSTAPARLLLGLAGWSGTPWAADYYPVDLPPDWRLAYYANDCDCLLLPADTWRDGISDALADALDEAPDHLWLFTESDGTAVPDPGLLPPQRIVLLSATDAPTLPGYRQWRAAGPDRWVDADSGACLLRWWVDDPDPRALREQANGLPPRVDAIVLDGPAAGPGLVRELRTLLELLGRG